MAHLDNNIEKNVCLNFPFASSETASLVREVLAVDKEIKGSKVRRELQTDGVNLIINFSGADLKMLRVAANSMIKNILLVVKTIEQFQHS